MSESNIETPVEEAQAPEQSSFEIKGSSFRIKGEEEPEEPDQAQQEPELDTTSETVAENNQTRQKSEQGTTKKRVDDNPTYCGEGHGIMNRDNKGFAWCKICSYGPGSERFIPKARRARKLLPFE